MSVDKVVFGILALGLLGAIPLTAWRAFVKQEIFTVAGWHFTGRRAMYFGALQMLVFALLLASTVYIGLRQIAP